MSAIHFLPSADFERQFLPEKQSGTGTVFPTKTPAAIVSPIPIS